MQGELEWSLEQLVRAHEQDWRDNLEQDMVMGDTYDEEHGRSKGDCTHLGSKFFKYK